MRDQRRTDEIVRKWGHRGKALVSGRRKFRVQGGNRKVGGRAWTKETKTHGLTPLGQTLNRRGKRQKTINISLRFRSRGSDELGGSRAKEGGQVGSHNERLSGCRQSSEKEKGRARNRSPPKVSSVERLKLEKTREPDRSFRLKGDGVRCRVAMAPGATSPGFQRQKRERSIRS